MKNFKKFLEEQHLTQGETTLDPEFVEKKEKKEKQAEQTLMRSNREVDREASKEEKVELPSE